MRGQMVTWQDYASLAGDGGMFLNEGGGLSGDLSQGAISMADVDALNKALAAGDDINAPATAAGEGFPLRVESLDSSLFNVTYKAKDIRFWKSLYKDAAFNTVEEFNRLEEYGSGDSIYISEGDLPEEDDSTYSRQYTKIKFMGTTRRVTHVMSLLKAAHGNAVAREVVNGTLFLLRQLERGLFWGDEDMVSVQFDGLEKLLVNAFGSTALDDGQLSGWEDTVNIIDCRGNPLSEDYITDGAERLVAEPNYGAPNSLWMDTGVCKDLSKVMYPKERYDLPAPSGGKAGINIKTVVTPFGDIDLEPDIFLKYSKIATVAGVGKAGTRPAAPTVAAPTSPVYAGADTTYWVAADNGTYIYQVVACSRYGKSAPTTSAAIAVVAGDDVRFVVTDNGPNTSYYEIYRTAAGGAAATARLILRVARTGASQTIIDLNRFLPDTSKAYMLTMQPEVMKWKQLAPFTKIPLATVDTSVRWMQVLYGALQVMMPLKNLIYINVGRLATGVEA